MHLRSVVLAALVVAPAAAQGVNCALLGTQHLHTPTYANIWGYVAPNGNEYALLGCSDGTAIVDTTIPTALVERAYIPGATSQWRELNTYLQYCYVCTEAGGAGIQVIDLTNPNAPVLANTFGNAQFNNCHTITCDRQTGRIYCNGTNNGTAVFDASVNQINPTFVGYITPGGQSNYWHDFHTRNGYGYASMIYNGLLRIYDISVWPAVVISSTSTPNTFTHNAWTNAASTVCATTDEVNGAFVKFWNITNKAAPVGLSQFTTNPVSCPHNAYIVGNLCHVSWYTEGYVLLDITNPSAPLQVASYDTYPGASGGFNGAWGVYPFQPSGNVYILDRQTGLYVVRPAVTDLAIAHTPLANTTNEDGPYAVLTNVTSSNPISSVTMNYRVGTSGAFTALPMTATATPNQYTANIPGQNATTKVQYYLDAVDSVGARRSPPSGQHEFFVGTITQVYSDDFEQNLGWTHGFTVSTDDWQRGVPLGRSGTSGGVPWADPSSAYSGTNCWGNDHGGTGFNGSYPNSAANWLQSPSIPTTGAQGLRLRYRRWLTLASGDTARVLVNGIQVFSTTAATNDSSWQLIEHDISAIANSQPNVTLRYELTTNATNVSGGWNLDNVELVYYSDAAPPLFYGVGTPGTGSIVPVMGMSAPAALGTTTQLQCSSILGGAPSFLVVNLAPDNTPIAGIIALVQGSGAAVLFQQASGAGLASWPFTVPNDPVFDNLYLYSQTVVIDPSGPGGLLAASQGMRFRVCLQ